MFICNECVKIPWLIWATYTRSRVLQLILYRVCRYFRKWKTCGRMKFYAAASLGSCEMILQNNFEPQKRGRVFTLVLEIQLIQIT